MPRQKLKETNMGINHAQGFGHVLQILLSDFWVILMFGLVYFGFKNHKWIKSMLMLGPKKKLNKDDHELMAVVHGAKVIGLGIVLVNLSYILAGLIFYLLPANPLLKEGSTMEYWMTIGFMTGTIGLMLAGYSLILSAGGRWLVYTAKFIATLSVLFMIGTLIASYL